MLFKELGLSPFKPFQDFVSVKKAKEFLIIPQSHFNMFDDNCPCGSERMIRISKSSGSITAVTCCNPHCTIKIVYQLTELFERFKNKGIGPAICNQVVSDFKKKNKVFTIADILIEGKTFNGLYGADEIEWDNALKTLKNSKQTFGSLIYKLGFPGIGSKFEDAMHGISSVPELSSIIAKEGFVSFFSKRGIKSLTALYYFTTYLPEISELSEYYSNTIITSAKKLITICLTGRMESSLGHFTKEQFLEQCIDFLEKRHLSCEIELKEVSSVAKATFIIAGRDSVINNTRKYQEAQTKQIKERQLTGNETYKILFSPDEFFCLLLEKGGV